MGGGKSIFKGPVARHEEELEGVVGEAASQVTSRKPPVRGSAGTTTRTVGLKLAPFSSQPTLLLPSSLTCQAGELGTASTPLSPSPSTPSHSSPTQSPFPVSLPPASSLAGSGPHPRPEDIVASGNSLMSLTNGFEQGSDRI